MKYYYLLNGKIMSANEKMPIKSNYGELYDLIIFKRWKESLQPCDISERELDNVKNYLCHNTKFEDFNPHEQIEVTEIVRLEEINTITKSGTITDYQLFFKHPKQVEEIEAVEFAEWLNENQWIKRTYGHPNNIGKYWSHLHCEYKAIHQLYEIFKNHK